MKRIHSSQNTSEHCPNAWDIPRWQWMTFDILRNCLRLSLRPCNFSAVLCPAQQSGSFIHVWDAVHPVFILMQLYCISQPSVGRALIDCHNKQLHMPVLLRGVMSTFARKKNVKYWKCLNFIYDPVADSPSLSLSLLIRKSSHRWN